MHHRHKRHTSCLDDGIVSNEPRSEASGGTGLKPVCTAEALRIGGVWPHVQKNTGIYPAQAEKRGLDRLIDLLQYLRQEP